MFPEELPLRFGTLDTADSHRWPPLSRLIGGISKTPLPALLLLTLAAHAAAAEPARAIPVCVTQQLLGFAPKDEEVRRHRLFGSPKIDYPFGTQNPSRDEWGFISRFE